MACGALALGEAFAEVGQIPHGCGDMAHLGAEPGQVVAGFEGVGVIGGEDPLLGRRHVRQLGRRRVVGSLGTVPACLASTGPEDLRVLAEPGPRVHRQDEAEEVVDRPPIREIDRQGRPLHAVVDEVAHRVKHLAVAVRLRTTASHNALTAQLR